MSRMLAHVPVLLSLALLVWAAGPASATPPGAVAEILTPREDDAGVLHVDTKELARARREATRADPSRWAVRRREALAHAFAMRLKLAEEGIELIVEQTMRLSQRLLDVSRALDSSPAARLAALEAHWARLWLVEQSGRVTAAKRGPGGALDLLTARAGRLQAEVWLDEARKTRGKPRPLAGTLQDLSREIADPLDTKELARAKFAAVRAEPRTLARARLEAERAVYEGGLRLASEGKEIAIEYRFAESLRLLDAEQAACDGPEARRVALAAHWARILDLEQFLRRSGERDPWRYTAVDAWEACAHRLQAEIWLHEARPRGGLQDPLAEVADPLDTRAMARAKLAVVGPDPTRLAAQRLEALRQAQAAMRALTYGGKLIDIERWFEESAAILEAELAADGSPGARRATLERYWARTLEIDELARRLEPPWGRRFVPGRVLSARAHRLQAEEWLAEAARQPPGRGGDAGPPAPLTRGGSR
jgi:hypothetical protein